MEPTSDHPLLGIETATFDANARIYGGEMEQYWTVEEVAARLRKAPITIKKWLIEKDPERRLKKTKAGAGTLISETNLQDFLRRCTDRANRAA